MNKLVFALGRQFLSCCTRILKISNFILIPNNIWALSFLSLIALNFSTDLTAQTASKAALDQRSAVLDMIHKDSTDSKIAFLTSFQNAPAFVFNPTSLNKIFYSQFTPLGAGIFLESQIPPKIASSFVPALTYFGSNGSLVSTAPRYSVFVETHPALAPLVSVAADVSANSTYPGLVFDADSGLVSKTAKFCTDLQGATGANFSWRGATCMVGQDNQCCDNLVCVADDSLKLGTTPGGKSYGVCDTPPCKDSGVACSGTGAGNCCQDTVKLLCDANICKIPVGAACTSGGNDCVTGTVCEPNVSAPTTGTCKVPLGSPCPSELGAAGCVTGASCGNVPAFGSNPALTNVCSITNGDNCANTGALYCQTGAICDTTLAKCVTAGQIKIGDSGCFANTDCLNSTCSVSGGATPGVCQCVNPAACTAGTCCSGSICDIAPSASSGGCVAEGKNLIPSDHTGCFTDADCITGDTCKGANGATPGICQAPCTNPDSCLMPTDCCNGYVCNSNYACALCIASGADTPCGGDGDCCPGVSCDLTTKKCVTAIPAGDGCTTLGTNGGCQAGQACQLTDKATGPAHTCQTCALNQSGCVVNNDPQGCFSATECCSCNCDIEGISGAEPTYTCVP